MEQEAALTDLERRALVAALDRVGSVAARQCLIKQVPNLCVTSRQNNRPYGFYTYFRCTGEALNSCSDEELNRKPPSAWGVYGARGNPISFVVYVRDGFIDFMEASTTISEWPEREDSIEFPPEAE